MTKVGEGSGPFKEPTVETYKAELDTSSRKFINALDQYNQSQNPKEPLQQYGVHRPYS